MMPSPPETAFSREAPSQHYRELLELYRAMHRDGEPDRGKPPERTFDGRSLAPHAGTIRTLIARYGARSLLDYGCGKGNLYRMKNVRDDMGQTHADIRSYWNLSDITLYDPGYEPYSRYPTGRFDAVISTDVLEHIPEEDLSWLVGELFDFAEKFVFANVAGYPATKCLPNGENAHCTIKPPEWWQDLFAQLAARRATGQGTPVRWFLLHAGPKDPTTNRHLMTPLQG